MACIKPLRWFALPLLAIGLLTAPRLSAQPLPAPTPEPPATLLLSAPPAPLSLDRIDFTDPEYAFVHGLWRADSEVPNPLFDYDLLAHLMRQAPVRTSEGTLLSNWFTMTASNTSFPAQLRSMATLAQPFRVLWRYVIQPDGELFSVHWAIRDYVARNPAGQHLRVAAVRSLPRQDDYVHSWVRMSGVEPQHILRAERYDYIVERREYVGPTVTLLNRNFVSSPRPPPARFNPFERFISLAVAMVEFPMQVPHLSDIARANGTVRMPQRMELNCLGFTMAQDPPATAQPREARPRREADQVTPCSHALTDIRPYAPPQVSRPSVLAFTLQSGNYCLTPRAAEGFVAARLMPCSDAAPNFEYDEYRRLSLRWNRNAWCLSAPRSVVEGTSTNHWDYLRFEPCALNATEQRWTISDGRIYSVVGDYALRERGEPILSRRPDANALRLAPKAMAAGFFDGPSPARSHAVELGMAWHAGASTYYSTLAGWAPWSRDYQVRNYYDYRLQTIAYVDLRQVSSEGQVLPQKYCLRSRQSEDATSTWDWTEWHACSDADGPTGWSRRWRLDVRTAASNPDQVRWRDMTGKPLWVVTRSNQNAGFFFTARDDQLDYSGSSSRFFSMRDDAIRLEAGLQPP